MYKLYTVKFVDNKQTVMFAKEFDTYAEALNGLAESSNNFQDTGFGTNKRFSVYHDSVRLENLTGVAYELFIR